MRLLLVLLCGLLACDDPPSEPVATAAPVTPAPPPVPTTPEVTPADPVAPTPSGPVPAAGLAVHPTVTVPPEIAAVARESRPEAIDRILAAGAGDTPGARVYWIAYRTSRFEELRGAAVDEGRLAAFEADLEAKMGECEANADVGDCAYCQSDCWDSVPSALADTTPEIRVVRVSAPANGAPRLDGSEVVWRGRVFDTTQLRVRTIEDLDGDGRPELSLALTVHGEFPAGDGADDEERHLVLDGDTLHLQVDLRRSFESDGHGGGVVESIAVSFIDRNDDGRKDYGVRLRRELTGLAECMVESGEEPPPECQPVDESVRAHYSMERDEWVLAEGETWPW